MLRSFPMTDLTVTRHHDCCGTLRLAVTASAAIHCKNRHGEKRMRRGNTACGLAMTGKARSVQCC